MGKHKKMSRKDFLKTAGCAALGSATFFSALFDLGMANEAAARSVMASTTSGDYKALVCILLAGGNDSFNMLVPSGGSAYNEYKTTRSNIALKSDEILQLNPLAGNQIPLGVHPAMPELQQLFNQGRLAFISNVGTLVEPTNKTQFNNGGVRVPLGLFSHADQIQQWQTSVPQSRNANGWGGRMADILQSMNTNQNISMNISLSGRNVFQPGNLIAEYNIRRTETGSIGIDGYKGNSTFDEIRTSAVDSLLEQQYNDLFTQTYSDIVKNAQGTHEMFSAAIESGNLSTAFSENEFSQALNMVAKTIAVRDELNVCRQCFFISYDGWDHHDRVLTSHQEMLGVLSKGLKEFDDAMSELGLGDQVTTFAMSDFARTLTSNGNGSDHGWGGNVFALGGAVKGGQVYGTYPTLALGSDLDVENGVLIPTLSTDEYFAELAMWFGVTATDLPTILPNLTNFYSLGGSAPIGFMKA